MDQNPQLSQLGLTFFGLTFNSAKQYRVNFLTQIHEICFYGQGGYRWQEVYDMPLWLRKFTYQKIKDHYDKQNDEIKKSKSSSPNVKELISSDGTIKSPEFFKKTSYK
jgi:hypothetical protein